MDDSHTWTPSLSRNQEHGASIVTDHSIDVWRQPPRHPLVHPAAEARWRPLQDLPDGGAESVPPEAKIDKRVDSIPEPAVPA